MAISDEISRLQSAKSALKTSIEGKGVTVSSSAKLEDYPALVDSIQAGGGSETVVLNLRDFAEGEAHYINLDNYGDSTVILYRNI